MEIEERIGIPRPYRINVKHDDVKDHPKLINGLRVGGEWEFNESWMYQEIYDWILRNCNWNIHWDDYGISFLLKEDAITFKMYWS